MPHTAVRLYHQKTLCHTLLHIFTIKDTVPHTVSRLYYHKILCHIQLHIFTIQRQCAANNFTSLLPHNSVLHTVSHLYYQKTLCHTHPHIFTIRSHCVTHIFTSSLSEGTVPHTSSLSEDTVPHTSSHLYYQKTLCHTHLHIFTIRRHCATHILTSLLSEDTVPHTSSRPYHTNKCWSWFYSSSLRYRHKSRRLSSQYEHALLVCSVFNPTNCTCNHKYLLYCDVPPTCNDTYRSEAGRSLRRTAFIIHAFLCKWPPWRWPLEA